MRLGKKVCILACMLILTVMCGCSHNRTEQTRAMENKTDVNVVLTQQAEENDPDMEDEQKAVINIEENPVADTGKPEADKGPEEISEKRKTGST